MGDGCKWEGENESRSKSMVNRINILVLKEKMKHFEVILSGACG
jgi:hypothetical protein